MAGSDVQKLVSMSLGMHCTLLSYGVGRSFIRFVIVEIKNVVKLIEGILCLLQLRLVQLSSDDIASISCMS